MSDPITLPGGPPPAVPANHSLANIGQNMQRTLVGLIIIGLTVASALGYVAPDKAGAAITSLLGLHYMTT